MWERWQLSMNPDLPPTTFGTSPISCCDQSTATPPGSSPLSFLALGTVAHSDLNPAPLTPGHDLSSCVPQRMPQPAHKGWPSPRKSSRVGMHGMHSVLYRMTERQPGKICLGMQSDDFRTLLAQTQWEWRDGNLALKLNNCKWHAPSTLVALVAWQPLYSAWVSLHTKRGLTGGCLLRHLFECCKNSPPFGQHCSQM